MSNTDVEVKEVLTAMGIKDGASEVARRVDITRPTVYSYFKKNRPLFDAVAQYTQRCLREETAEAVRDRLVLSLRGRLMVAHEVVGAEGVFIFLNGMVPVSTRRVQLDGLNVERAAASMCVLLPE